MIFFHEKMFNLFYNIKNDNHVSSVKCISAIGKLNSLVSLSVKTAGFGRFQKLKFRILHFWPQIRILHTKIALDPNFYWFWYTMTTLPRGSKSMSGHKIRKSAYFDPLDFFISYMRQAHHVVHHWIAIELVYPKRVLIPLYNVSPRTILYKCNFFSFSGYARL